MQTSLYLWLLFHLDIDRKEREARLEELRNELEEKENHEKEETAALKQVKKKASAARRKFQSADKQRVKHAAEVDQLEPSHIQATEEIKTLKTKVQKEKSQLQKKRDEVDSHKKKLDKLTDEATSFNRQLQELEAEYEELKRSAAPNQITLSAEQEDEFERVKEAAAAASVEPRRKLAAVKKKLEAARAKVVEVASNLKEMNNRKSDVAREVESLRDRMKTLSDVRMSTFTATALIWSVAHGIGLFVGFFFCRASKRQKQIAK